MKEPQGPCPAGCPGAPTEFSWFYDLIDGKRAKDVGPLLGFTAAYMRNHSKRLSEKNPSNGWGDVDRCADWIERIADACRAHPDGVMTGSA